MDRNPLDDAYADALAAWAKRGKNSQRPDKRPDGIPTRCDTNWMTPAELAITAAMAAVEAAGASEALTHAVMLLSMARGRVADHIEA